MAISLIKNTSGQSQT